MMDFNFQRHMRLAGAVAALIGTFLHSWIVVFFGWAVFALACMISLVKIEAYIEAETMEKEKDDVI